ncbi:hypothetical protein BD309DRAFT_963905 [Dichomitus squalens]|uniref:Uncharacterized protein n=1 Tax=Dichomitus squalens TaxID=114155 RepID=A0A4Q9NL19_9APHY|nr:hypothetical protein BD311DRAFT_744376 [Dichomitus squalens]TBU42070.1 hypothetical protein BD309DRAFT_963905 [Dichomitus squalens]
MTRAKQGPLCPYWSPVGCRSSSWRRSRGWLAGYRSILGQDVAAALWACMGAPTRANGSFCCRAPTKKLAPSVDCPIIDIATQRVGMTTGGIGGNRYVRADPTFAVTCISWSLYMPSSCT